ncbi:MAG: hypothetical protein M4D80_38985 [Myxococcota bacterium]|nr:hypothetical protein [Myxococcota bacterium]
MEERTSEVSRRGRGEYEDIEESRTKSSASEIDDADIVDEVDLDASPDGDGPDA